MNVIVKKEGSIVTGITVTKTDNIFQGAVAALIWSCFAAKYSKLVWQAEMELFVLEDGNNLWKCMEYGGDKMCCWTVLLDAAGLDNDKVTICDKKLFLVK